MAPVQLSVGLGFDCRVGEEARAAWGLLLTGTTASLPRLMKGLRREEEELFAELYQPLVAEPAKQEDQLKLHTWPIRGFYRTEHCSLSTASGGAAHGFHTPPALKNKHLLATLQLQSIPVPNSPGAAGEGSGHLH